MTFMTPVAPMRVENDLLLNWTVMTTSTPVMNVVMMSTPTTGVMATLEHNYNGLMMTSVMTSSVSSVGN